MGDGGGSVAGRHVAGAGPAIAQDFDECLSMETRGVRALACTARDPGFLGQLAGLRQPGCRLQIGVDLPHQPVDEERAVGAIEGHPVGTVELAARVVIPQLRRPSAQAVRAEQARLIAHDKARVFIRRLDEVGHVAVVAAAHSGRRRRRRRLASRRS